MLIAVLLPFLWANSRLIARILVSIRPAHNSWHSMRVCAGKIVGWIRNLCRSVPFRNGHGWAASLIQDIDRRPRRWSQDRLMTQGLTLPCGVSGGGAKLRFRALFVLRTKYYHESLFDK
jgi:hypothetical protein